MHKKIRVLHVLKSSIYSGAENIAITIIKHLDENFEAAYLATEGEIEAVLKNENVTYFLLSKYTRKGISDVVKKYQPDIIHAHDFSATVLCTMISGNFHLISHLHYDPPWVKYWNLRTLAYSCCRWKIDKVLTVSSNMFHNMVFANKFREKMRVVKNPLDVESVKQKAIGEVSNNIPVIDIIFVGRFVEQKNPQAFIYIIKELKKRGLTKLNCLMLGDGVLLDECRSLVKDNGLDDTIQLIGFQKNPYAFIKNSTLMCVTSKWEGYGLVIAEADILGIPVLSTKTSGACEILGKKAWEICESEEDFIDKALKLLSDPVQYEIQKDNARRRVEHLESIKDYISLISSIYAGEVDDR